MKTQMLYVLRLVILSLIFGTTAFYTTNFIWGWVENPWAALCLRYSSWGNAVLWMFAYFMFWDKIFVPVLNWWSNRTQECSPQS